MQPTTETVMAMATVPATAPATATAPLSATVTATATVKTSMTMAATAMATARAMPSPILMTTMINLVTTVAMAAPWLVCANSTVHTHAAAKTFKLRCVKPAVERILNADDVQQQAAVLRAVADHPALMVVQELAGIDYSKEIAAAKFVCKQSSGMMGRACSGNMICGKTSQ